MVYLYHCLHMLEEYATDTFERVHSSPSSLVSDPDPIQSGLVDQKPNRSNPIRIYLRQFLLSEYRVQTLAHDFLLSS